MLEVVINVFRIFTKLRGLPVNPTGNFSRCYGPVDSPNGGDW